MKLAFSHPWPGRCNSSHEKNRISRSDSYCYSFSWTCSSHSYPSSHHVCHISELFEAVRAWALFLCLKFWEIRQDIPVIQAEKFNILQRQKCVKMKLFVWLRVVVINVIYLRLSNQRFTRTQSLSELLKNLKVRDFFTDLTWEENKAISECILIINFRRLKFVVLAYHATKTCTVT